MVTKNKERKVIGIITMEDIIEILMGKILDEDDKKQLLNFFSNDKIFCVVEEIPLPIKGVFNNLNTRCAKYNKKARL